MKILVADDSKTTRALLAASLNKMGHDVIEAANGQQAIELFKREHPDLIILDVIMEGIDGFECAKMIRNIDTEDWIPIIFLSGAVDDENIARGINAGGDDYLTKPYSEITLAAKVKAMQRIADMRAKLWEMTKKFSMLSATDSLTGVYNRLQFNRVIIEKVASSKRYHTPFALLYLDLDKFKLINDTLGHYVGDLLLVEVARRLKSCIRVDDFIARVGGDEFSILLNNTHGHQVINSIAKKILNALEQPYLIAGNDLEISASIGIVCYPSDDTTEENLTQNADIAMYHAKEAGRNNYKYYTPELAEEHSHRENVKNALRHAVENNELYLKYQPVYHLKTNEINRVEALLCWNSKLLGDTSAAFFIPLIEEIELIDTVGEWVLRTACEQGKKWYDAGCKNIRLSVNISPQQLAKRDLPQLISNIIRDVKISPDILELEITEASGLIYSKNTEQIIHEISKIGVKISLDDFGTGYSSLNYLRELPISAIKIDKSFVGGIHGNKQNLKIIKAVITFGDILGYDVIAEGIENEDQLKILIANKCILGQGFYLCKPLSETEISKILPGLKVNMG